MEFVTAKGVIKALVSPIVDLCGIYDAVLARRVFARPSWLILMYHRIIDTSRSDPFQLGMCVDRLHFAEQLDFLTRSFTPIRVDEAIDRLRMGKPLPRNALSVTFDDGYADLPRFALPILERYNCPATVYVSTGGIEQQRHFWWDRVIASFAATRRSRLDLDLDETDGSAALHLGLGNRRHALLRTLDALWQQPAHRLDSLADRIETDLGTSADCLKADRLALDEVARLDQAGVEIAVHCDLHGDLTRMRPDAVMNDMHKSRALLEETTGRRLRGFAYPGGRQNATVQRLVSHAGFNYAAGTGKGLNRQPLDMMNLRRIGMPNTSIADFKRCLSIAARDEKTAISSEPVSWP